LIIKKEKGDFANHRLRILALIEVHLVRELRSVGFGVCFQWVLLIKKEKKLVVSYFAASFRVA